MAGDKSTHDIFSADAQLHHEVYVEKEAKQFFYGDEDLL